jgi:hypothetical protein
MLNPASGGLTLQRYLTRHFLQSFFSVRQKGAVVAPLDPGYQLENVRNRQDLQGQDHREQAPKL